MEIGSNVWVKNTLYKDPTKDDLWVPRVITAMENQPNNKVKVTIANESNPALVFTMDKFATETPEVKLRNPSDLANHVENLIDLPGLNEPEMLQALKNRYFKQTTYTYTGSILIAINPFNLIAQNETSDTIVKNYCSTIRNDIISQINDGFESTQQVTSEIDFSSSAAGGEGKTVKDHSILISGESGSGKTEISKLLLRYLSTESASSPSSRSKNHLSADRHSSGGGSGTHQVAMSIIKSTPILEALGHARTVYTYNSSRFAKCLELSLNAHSSLLGGAVRSYLLETSRITSQLPGERNYHIFYQLLAGASPEEREALHLSGSSATSHKLINQGQVASTPATEQQDADDYQVLRSSLREMGVEDALAGALFRLVAGLLHLGDIDYYEVYDSTGEGGEICKESLQALAHVAELCDFSEQTLQNALTIRTIVSRSETYTKKLTRAQCISGKDALAKALYKRAFDTIVNEVNKKICVSRSDEDDVVCRLSILDIFGFDCFAVNTFEQLCINYANEILQQQFNQQIFKLELLEYNKECISFDSIDFVDNQDTLELINNQIFKVLDDQCKLANATDARFVAMLYTVCAGKKKFTASGKQQRDGVFIIQHFAGPVTYSPEKFIEKNLDELPQDAVTLIGTSKNAVLNSQALIHSTPSFLERASSVRDMGAAPGRLEHSTSIRDMHTAAAAASGAGAHNAGFPRKTAAKASAVGQFKSELSVLIKQINATVPHYIRCINPLIRESEAHSRAVSSGDASNSGGPNTLAARANTAASLQFHQLRVAEQLRSGGVLEAVRVARSGYPFRLDHLDFYARYRLLANPKNEVTVGLPRILAKNSPVLQDKDGMKHLLEQLLAALLRPPNSPASIKYVKSVLDIKGGGAGGGEVASCLAKVCSPLSTSHTIQVGLTKVFMKKSDREVLETSLLALRKFAGEKIYSIVYFYHVRTKFQKILSGARLLQRVVRSAAVRIKIKKEKVAQKEAHEKEQVAKANAEAIAVQQAAAAEVQAVKAKQAAEEKAARQKVEAAEAKQRQALKAETEARERAEQEAAERERSRIAAAEAEAAAKLRRQESAKLTLDTNNLEGSSPAQTQQVEQRHDQMMRSSLALTVNTEYVAAKVAEYKVLDTSLLAEINALISNKKVSDEDSILRFDIERAKKLLRDWMSYLGAETQLYTRVNDIANSLDYGYMLLSSEKLIPMTTLGKAFSFGKKVTASDRTASAKYANKVVDKEHKMFKQIFRMLERIKDCLELAKSDREEIEQKRRQSAGGAQLNLIDTLLHYITKISDFCKILYTYYYQYILHTVAEYGDGSPFKQSFHDEVAYILALAELIDQRKPLISSELKQRKENEDNNGFFSVTNTVSKLSRSVASDDKIHFKSIPYAPGVEFTVNCLNILLNGEMLMYPIRFIKLVGKSASNYNQVAYYQASTKLCDATLHTVLREPQYVQSIDIDSFSSSLLTVLLLGAVNVQPDNFMLKVHRDFVENTLQNDHNMSMMSIDNSTISSIVLQGINNDQVFTSGLFQYQQILEAEDLIDRIGTSDADEDLASRLNILLFLPQMQCPVSPRLRKLLVASNTSVDLLMSNWLRELFLQNRRYDYLKQSGFTNEDLAALKLPIRLPPGVSLQIFSKLKLIKKYLKENPRALNINLLTEIHPTLANYYDALRKQNSEALSSYKSNPILANANRNAVQNVNFTTPQDRTLEAYTMTVEDTALELMTAMDFSTFTTQDDLICCKMIIDNLSFLPVLYLYRVTEAQLYAMFSNLIDSTMETNRRNINASMGQNPPPPPRSQINVKRVVLTGLDEETKMHLLKNSRILMCMHSVLGFVIYFDNEMVECVVSGHGPNSPSLLQLSPRSRGGAASINAHAQSFYNRPMEDPSPVTGTIGMIDGEIKRKLQYLLNNYSNLTHNKSLAEMSTDIVVIKEMVRQACSGQDPDEYDLETVKQYGNILLEFPGLTNITKDLAVKGIFNKNRNIIYPMLDHDQLDRYVDIIVSILRSDPARLYVKYNTTRPVRGLSQIYPCDVIHSVPDNKIYKYRILAALINMACFSNVVFVTLAHSTAAGGSLPPVITSSTTELGGTGQRFLSYYEGEEELISRAVNYGLSCTEEELAQKLYHIDKVDLMDSSQGKISPNGVFAEGNLLHRCAQVSVIEPGNKRLHTENMETFKLLVQAFKLRVDADHMTPRDVAFFFHECETKSGDTFMSICSRAPANGGVNYLLTEFYASWDDAGITGQH